MANFAEEFISEIASSTVIQSAGSILLVGRLNADENEPTVKTLTIGTAPTLGDTQLELSTDIDVVLRAGSILAFTTGDAVVVATETEVTAAGSPVNVPIDEITGTPPGAGDTHQTWALLRILSPTSLPMTNDSQNVDRKDYTFGLQGSEVKVRTNLNSSITIINQLSDRAYWTIVQPAGLDSNNIFGMIVTNSETAFGAVQVSSLSMDNAIDEIQRPTFDFMFQAPFARVVPYQYLDTAQQAALNTVRGLAGLRVLS